MFNSTSPAKILIVDDHPLVREGIKVRLSSCPEFEVCGEAETAAGAIAAIQDQAPDVVILDLSLPDRHGLELVKQIAAMPDGPRILVCSTYDEKLYAQRCIHSGASGFLHKQQASSTVLQAIRRILSGKIFVSEETSEIVLSQLLQNPERGITSPLEQLTERELQVFESIGRGLTINQIAAELHLSTKTIETYRDRTKRKLNLRTSAELLRYAVRSVTESATS